MNILTEKPPIYDEIVEFFPAVASAPNGVFTFGDIIYNPSGVSLPVYLIAHEKVHSEQQKVHGVKQWWYSYLRSAEFRLEQELPAYKKEYEVFCEMFKDRNEQNSFLNYQGLMLSSPMYGSMITASEARKLIKA